MLGRFPNDLYYVTCLVFTVPLLLHKFLYYRSQKWHYFFFDFCYFGNTWIYLFIFLFPESKLMYVNSFMFATGHMAYAIVGFRNSLVMHDLDRMSSLLIHAVPLKIMWNLHWFSSRTDEGFNFWNPEEGVTLFEYFQNGVIFFWVHQLIYVFFNFFLFKKKIKQRGYENSFTYFKSAKGFPGNLVRGRSEGVAQLIYSGVSFLFFIVNSLLAWLFFNCYLAHTIWVVFLLSVAAWNGANFYMEYFSRKYEHNLTMLDTLQKEMEEQLKKED